MKRTIDVVMAGFGGQGMLLAGKILAQAAMEQGLQVSWLPSYGPEMRGGTANVVVRISHEPIAAPLVDRPGGLVVMNRPSLEKFAPRVAPGGVIVVNRTLVDVDAGRDDCTIVDVPSRDLAIEAGAERAANLVMLGAWLGVTEAVPAEALERAVAAELPGEKAKWIPANVAAFRSGLELGRTATAGAVKGGA